MSKAKDEREHLMEMCFAILGTSGWQDDPGDKVRTMASMQLACVHYVDAILPYMDEWPIYVEKKSDPDCMVGIEQVFDVVVLYSDGREIRYVGTIDGLALAVETNEPHLDDNKTASRLGNGWRAMFEMSNQITGYTAACEVFFGFPVRRSRIIGVKIPPGHGEDVYIVTPLPKTEESYRNWGLWLRSTVDTYEKYERDFESAPRFSHSCNRYFRPCALIPFCADTMEGRSIQWEQMIEADKSPSERAVMEMW